MSIEKMGLDHLGAVKELLDTCFGDSTWSPDMICAQLKKPESHCTVAMDGDRVVGFLAFEQIMDEGSVIEAAVHPAYRRQGIARNLITSTLAGADNLRSVFLEVRESNRPAIALYESLGFEKISTRKNYYDNPKENAVIMKRSMMM